MRMVGVEIYFEDLERARSFYEGELGLAVTDEKQGRFAQFGGFGGPLIAAKACGQMFAVHVFHLPQGGGFH